MGVLGKWWFWVGVILLVFAVPWPEVSEPGPPIRWSRDDGKAWPETHFKGFKIGKLRLDSGIAAHTTISGSPVPGVRGAHVVIQAKGQDMLVTRAARLLGEKLMRLPHVQRIEVYPPATMPDEGSPLPDYQIFLYGERETIGWTPFNTKTRFKITVIHGTRLTGLIDTGAVEIYSRLEIDMKRRVIGLVKGDLAYAELSESAAELLFTNLNQWTEAVTKQGFMPSFPKTAMARFQPLPGLPIWDEAPPDPLNAYATATGNHHGVYLLKTDEEAEGLFRRLEDNLSGWDTEFQLTENTLWPNMLTRRGHERLEIKHLTGPVWLVQYENSEPVDQRLARLESLAEQTQQHPLIAHLLNQARLQVTSR